MRKGSPASWLVQYTHAAAYHEVVVFLLPCFEVMTRWLSFAALRETYAEEPEALDDAMSLVANDLQIALHQGIDVTIVRDIVKLRLCPVGVKGDWPFLIEAAHLERHFRRAPKRGESQMTCPGICHLCMGGYGQFHFEDFTAAPAWERTMYSAASLCPWESEAPWQHLPGLPDFRPWTFRPDIFHNWHLGCGRYFVSSALVVLVQFENGGEGGLDVRLQAMTVRWLSFCKSRKESWFVIVIGV